MDRSKYAKSEYQLYTCAQLRETSPHASRFICRLAKVHQTVRLWSQALLKRYTQVTILLVPPMRSLNSGIWSSLIWEGVISSSDLEPHNT
jgi:hypothetical protein